MPDQQDTHGRRALIVTSSLQIPISEFEFLYSRSSGPGGQNINKLNTRVQLRWDVARSTSLPDAPKSRFLESNRSRLIGDGTIQVTSQRYRDQRKNYVDCLEKLRVLILEALYPPKARRKTRPTRASKERRLERKRERSSRKKNRRRPNWDD